MKRWGYEAVLLDMDGVVLDSMGQHAASWIKLLGAEGIPVTRDFILAHEGALGLEVMLKLRRECGCSPLTRERAMTWMLDLFARQIAEFLENHASRIVAYPDALPVLERFSGAGVPTALVTSSSRDVVDACLPPELEQLFCAVITRNDVERHKPNPDPYLAGARSLGKEPGCCLAIENAPPGIQSANASGAVCYALSTTLPPDHLSRAKGVFPSLSRLMEHLGMDGSARHTPGPESKALAWGEKS